MSDRRKKQNRNPAHRTRLDAANEPRKLDRRQADRRDFDPLVRDVLRELFAAAFVVDEPFLRRNISVGIARIKARLEDCDGIGVDSSACRIDELEERQLTVRSDGAREMREQCASFLLAEAANVEHEAAGFTHHSIVHRLQDLAMKIRILADRIKILEVK